MGLSKDAIKRLEQLGKSKASALAEEASKKLTSHYVSLIDWFYADYSPKMYKRTFGLYNSYRKFNKNSQTVYYGGVIVSPDKMHDYEADENPFLIDETGRIYGLIGRRDPISASDLLSKFIYNPEGTWHGGNMQGGYGLRASFNLYNEIHSYHEQLKDEYRKRCSV